eukprot:s1688_g17.t1
MHIRVTGSHLARVVVPCLAMAKVCLMCSSQTNVLQFLHAYEIADPKVIEILDESIDKWFELPLADKRRFLGTHQDHMIRGFMISVVLSMEFAEGIRFTWIAHHDLVAACKHALGQDVDVEMVGSRTRRTAAVQNQDMDIQVRRSRKSGRRDEPFTDADKQRVAQYLEKLPCVTGPVTIGRVAIKFEMEHIIAVDLVLWFLKETPAARAAIIGIKECYQQDRPKGILLESIAWRLSKTCPFSLTRTAPVYAKSDKEAWNLQVECFRFFLYMRNELRNWEASCFGRRLTRDLASLPESKGEEHIQRFQMLGRANDRDIWYMMLLAGMMQTAREEWTQQDGPRHLYFRKRLAEFFPYDL